MKKIILIVLLLLVPVIAQGKKLQVLVSEFPPHVMKGEDGKLTGFDIELWDKISKLMGRETRYSSIRFKDIFYFIPKDKADVALAGITITGQRESSGMDFSHSYMHTGLGIMVNDNGTTIISYMQGLFTSGVRRIILILFAFIFLVGHWAWFIDKGKISTERALSDKYFPGIFEAMWWVLVTVSTVGYGDIVPKNWQGKAIGALTIVIGLAIFGLYIGEVSSAMTLQKITSNIESEEDLRGKKVVTIKDTTSVRTLGSYGVKIIEANSVDDAVSILQQEKAQAFVFDKVALLYYKKKNPSRKVEVLNIMFDEQDYGIAFREGSKLREKVNRELLKLQKNGEYEELYEKYFGN